MTVAAVVFFVLLGIALIIGRRPIAHAQSLVLGGHTPPGCVVVEAIALFVLALVFALFLRD